MPQIILASASPRRRELLSQINVLHLVQTVDIDETPFENELPENYVQRLALEKALACRKNSIQNSLFWRRIQPLFCVIKSWGNHKMKWMRS